MMSFFKSLFSKNSKEFLKKDHLYVCNNFYLNLYHDRRSARTALSLIEGSAAVPVNGTVFSQRDIAVYWEDRLKKPVLSCDPGVPFIVVESSGDFAHVLSGGKIGWIIYRDWIGIREVKTKTD